MSAFKLQARSSSSLRQSMSSGVATPSTVVEAHPPIGSPSDASNTPLLHSQQGPSQHSQPSQYSQQGPFRSVPSVRSHGSSGAMTGETGTTQTRPCREHKFLIEVNDVRQMEAGLLDLLSDFHSGKLQAFGGSDYFAKMDRVREQQEHLARMHFDLDCQQQEVDNDTKGEGHKSANVNRVNRLMGDLEDLSKSIQALKGEQAPKSATRGDKSSGSRKHSTKTSKSGSVKKSQRKKN